LFISDPPRYMDFQAMPRALRHSCRKQGPSGRM
jgi:hypothetical protein